MRTLLIILGVLSALLGLALSILPFGKIALIPIIAAFIFGIIAFKLTNKKGGNKLTIKVIFLITIIALALNIYNSLQPNEIVENQDQIEEEIKAEEEDLEELEGLELE